MGVRAEKIETMRKESDMADDRLSFLDRKAVCSRISVGKTKLYEWIKEETFPKAHEIAPGIKRWRSDEVEAWIKTRAPVAA